MKPDSTSELVLAEDFSGYDAGPLSEAVDPVHETHFLRKTVNQGPWTETSVYHTNRMPNVNIQWVIDEIDGKKVLKQTGINKEGVLSWGNFVRRHILGRDFCPLLFFPSLATGSGAWRNYTLEVSVVPLSRQLCGVLFRSATSIQHYVFGLERGRARLMVRRFNSLEVLASRRYPHAIGTPAVFSVAVSGNTIRCTADGQEVFNCEDATFHSGGCGILANGPAVFRSVKVYMSRPDREAADRATAEQALHAAALHRQYPSMQLSKRIELPVTAPGRSIRFGDLSGRGGMEYLIVHAGDDLGRSGLSLTAVDTDGRVIWQRGEARRDEYCRIRDAPVQIHDIDGDGRCEVICYSDGCLQILDGATGALKHTRPGPEVEAGQPAGGRLNGDSIFICNLAGGPRSADVLFKDVYSQVFAYDSRLEPLWNYRCKTGHYPFAVDIDGDGKDEVLIGYTLLRPNGRRLWSIPLNDHADAVAIVKSPSTGEWVVAIAASNEGFVFADVRGRKRHHLRIGHMQTITAGRLVAGSDDVQIATNTYWGNPGVVYILGLDGTIINTFQPSIHGSPMSPVRWIRGRQDLILLSAAAGLEGGLYDSSGTQVVAFPDDGHPELCHFVCDVDGDGLEEIVCWDHHELWVYRSEETGSPGGQPLFRLPASYNQSNYRSHVTP